MTFIHELDRYPPNPSRCTGCAKTNFLRQGFRKLSSDRQTDGQKVITIMYDNYNPRRFTDGKNSRCESYRLRLSEWALGLKVIVRYSRQQLVSMRTPMYPIFLRSLKYLRHDSSAIDGYLSACFTVFICITVGYCYFATWRTSSHVMQQRCDIIKGYQSLKPTNLHFISNIAAGAVISVSCSV